MNFDDIFRKDVTYENIQSHKKAGLHLLSRKYMFGKTTGGGQIEPPLSLFRVKVARVVEIFKI